MRFPALLLLTVAACATAPQPKATPDLSPSPPAQLHRMAVGRLPHLRLREMALGTTLQMDSIMQGNSPTASGQIPCATAANTATWQTPASCGLTDLSSTQTVSGAKTFSGGITVGSSGTAISTSLRVTTTRAAASIPANSCATTTATMTGVAAGADCRQGINPGFSGQIQVTCQYDTTNTVRWQECNPTTGAITFPASGLVTLSCRCDNP